MAVASLAAIALFSWLPALWPPLDEYAAALIAAAFIYLPAAVLWRKGEGFDTIGVAGLRSWLPTVTLPVMAVVFPLFAAGFFLWHGVVQGASACIDSGRVGGVWWAVEFLALQCVLVAIPEEIFYRGYLQTRLQQVFRRRLVVLGGDVGPAVWVTSAVFAAGHFVSIPVPSRLAVFFPSLLFGWLRCRTGSVWGPAALHALSNLVLEVLGRLLC